jgi:hypothetical protein
MDIHSLPNQMESDVPDPQDADKLSCLVQAIDPDILERGDYSATAISHKLKPEMAV